MLNTAKSFKFLLLAFVLIITTSSKADNTEIKEVLELIQKDLRTLERAVYSESFSQTNNTSSNNLDKESEDVLTRHLLKLSEIEKQFQQLTNKYEEINFKIDKLNSRLSKVQADNQLRFQQLETGNSQSSSNLTTSSLMETEANTEKILPGSTQPQDLGTVSYKDMTDKSENQAIQSVDTYWYAETFRIRQLYTDAASAYLEGYQKYPKSEKAPINLLKLGVSLVQIGEKDQGCLMIAGVKKQYPDATQSVLQKAKYEEKKYECKKENS